jgi:hypothetical protein
MKKRRKGDYPITVDKLLVLVVSWWPKKPYINPNILGMVAFVTVSESPHHICFFWPVAGV